MTVVGLKTARTRRRGIIKSDAQTQLRMPQEVKDKLVKLADKNMRSLSGEILHRLMQSLKDGQ